MVRIRLSLNGSKKRPFYKIVVTDVRNSRDGRFIETVGYFNPICTKVEFLNIKMDRVNYWIKNGAVPTKRVLTLMKCKNSKKIHADENKK